MNQIIEQWIGICDTKPSDKIRLCFRLQYELSINKNRVPPIHIPRKNWKNVDILLNGSALASITILNVENEHI